MNRIRPLRLAAVAVLVASLSACGFHLRNKIALPSDLGPVLVTSSSPYSPLAELVGRGLRLSGAVPAEEGAKDVATLKILSERWGNLPIAIDELGRAQEYALRYAAVFEFRSADGSVLVPQQVVELSRDYLSSPTDVTGSNTEQEILADEMRKDMAASILRRVDSVIEGGIVVPAGAAPQSDAQAPADGETAPGADAGAQAQGATVPAAPADAPAANPTDPGDTPAAAAPPSQP